MTGVPTGGRAGPPTSMVPPCALPRSLRTPSLPEQAAAPDGLLDLLLLLLLLAGLVELDEPAGDGFRGGLVLLAVVGLLHAGLVGALDQALHLVAAVLGEGIDAFGELVALLL